MAKRIRLIGKSFAAWLKNGWASGEVAQCVLWGSVVGEANECRCTASELNLHIAGITQLLRRIIVNKRELV